MDSSVSPRRLARRLAIVALAALTAVGVLAGCGSSSSGSTGTSGGGSSAKPVHIAYLVSLLDDFTQQEVNGAKTAIGPSGSVTAFNGNYNPQTQLTQCQDALTSGRYNAMIISAASNAAIVPCVKQAYKAHIPVVSADSPIGDSLFTAKPQVQGVVGSVSGPANQNAVEVWKMDQLACKNVNPCGIIVEIASLGDPLTHYLLDYVKQQSAKTPNIHVDAYFASNYDPSVTQQDLPSLLQTHSDARVVDSAFDDSAAQAVKVVKQLGDTGKVRVISNGGSYQGKALVQSGGIYALLATYPISYGEAEGKMLKQAVNGETVSPEVVPYFTYVQPSIVTKQNVAQFKPQWGPQS